MRQSPIATKKHEQNISPLFGQKNLELLPENWKLNGNIVFEFFLVDLDEKMTLAGYKRGQIKTQCETVRKADNLFNLVENTQTFQKAFLWIIRALQASN